MNDNNKQPSIQSNTETFRMKSGLDITTGHGADSFYYKDEIADPWASRCLMNFIDTVINHEAVEYPLPSDAAINKLDDDLLPKMFVQGRVHRLITPKTEISAEKVRLGNDELSRQFTVFSKWAMENALWLARWTRFHRENRRLADSHSVHVPIHMVDEFWNRLPKDTKDNFTATLRVPDSYVSYSFDVFVRSIQYHHILGASNPNFFHPIRDKAFDQLSITSQYQNQWSWGKYFTGFCKDEGYLDDRLWLFAKLENLRELTLKYDATWYDLDPMPKGKRIELLSSIATECNLPAKLKDGAVRLIRGLLTAATILNLSDPVTSIALAGGRVAAQIWSGSVPTILATTIPVLKGIMVWPGVTDVDS